MSADDRGAAPRWGAILLEQLRTVGSSVRREAALLSAVLALITLVVLASHVATGVALDFSVELAFPVALLGLFGPMAVWKEEEPARRLYFWALPVDRFRHTLVKVFSGWIWLMLLIAAYLIWGLALAGLTGGAIGTEEMRLLVGEVPEGARPSAADYHLHRQVTPAWQWLVPFTSATVLYLLGSIVVLRSDRPWRYFAAFFFGYFLLLVLAEAAQLRWLHGWVGALQTGTFGWEMLITGSADSLAVVTAPSGAQGEVWLDSPRRDLWSAATLLWTGAALIGVVLAARRYQER